MANPRHVCQISMALEKLKLRKIMLFLKVVNFACKNVE